MADIDYGKIINRSWEITKKNKWLWVYGLVLAAAGGGSFSNSGGGGGGSGGGKTTVPSFQATPSATLKDSLADLPSSLINNASQVLGATTNALREWFLSVSPLTWALVILVIIIAVLFSIVVALVLQNWARGALITGLKIAANDETVTLLNTSPKGITSLKNLIIFSLIEGVVSLIVGLLTVLVIFLLILLTAFIPGVGIFFAILGGVVGGLTLVVVVILMAMISIYAERLIVLKNYRPWQAWKEALSLSKKSFFQTLVMGLINQVIGCVSGCLITIAALIVVGIPALILIVPLFAGGFHFPGVPVIILLLLLFLIFIYLTLLVRAIIVVFTYSNWNLFFEEIVKNE